MRSFRGGGDFWSGLALAGLGTYIVACARGWTYMSDDGPGPGFFPLWYGSVMIVLSLLLVVGAVRRQSPETGTVNWPEVRRALLCWGAFVACVALMRVLGFAVSFALLTWFLVVAMAGKSHRVAIPLAVAFAAGFQILFPMLLDVALPPGLLFSFAAGQ